MLIFCVSGCLQRRRHEIWQKILHKKLTTTTKRHQNLKSDVLEGYEGYLTNKISRAFLESLKLVVTKSILKIEIEIFLPIF